MITKRRVIVLWFLLGLIALQLVSADHHKKNKKHRDHDDDDHHGKGGKGHHGGDHDGKEGKHHGGKHHGGWGNGHGHGHGCGDWIQKRICAGAVEKCYQFARNETSPATQKTEITACLKLQDNLDDCAEEVNKGNEGCFMKCTQNCNVLTTFNNWATCLQSCDNCTNVTNAPYGFCEKYVDKCRKLASQLQGVQNQSFANEVCNQINVTSCNQDVAEGRQHCYKKCGHKCYKHHSEDFIEWNVCQGYCHVKCAEDDDDEDDDVWGDKDHDHDHDNEGEDDDEEDGERRRKKHKGNKKHKKDNKQKKHKKNKQKKHKKEQKKHKKNKQNKDKKHQKDQNKKHDNNKNHHRIQAPVPAPTTDHIIHRTKWYQIMPH